MQLGSINSHLRPVEEDLTSRIDALFGRYPALRGFAVQNGASLQQDFPGVALEGALVVSNVGVYPQLAEAEHDRLCNEIAVALHEFIAQRPEGADMLMRGRTFARTLQ